ncbi:MAG: hypothetical protein JWO30_343 [Fibrobacteres bacterium]|nr:hypothetical protein [Fibrobacterota bacterium]
MARGPWGRGLTEGLNAPVPTKYARHIHEPRLIGPPSQTPPIVISLTRVIPNTGLRRLIDDIMGIKEVVMVTFPQAVAQAMKFVEARQSELWLGRLDRALERRGIDEARRERWRKALAPFLARHALKPELLRPGQVQSFIEEQADSGRYEARTLIDLIQALSFFYDSVVEQRELAGEAGHPFDMPAEDWAVSTISETLGSMRTGTANKDWSKARVY